MEKIEGGGSFNVCTETGAVTRHPESTLPEADVIAQQNAVPDAPAEPAAESAQVKTGGKKTPKE